MRRKSMLLVVAVTVLLTACGGTEESVVPAPTSPGGVNTDTDAGGKSAPSGELRMGMHIGKITLDPHMVQAGFQPPYVLPIYDTLLRRDTDLSILPGLATEWGYVDEVGLVFRMTLRDDVTFHDGEHLDADAVRQSLERGMSLDGPQTGQLKVIEEVVVLGDYEVELRLSRPSPTLQLDLSSVMGMIISPSGIDGDLETDPAGSGGWIFNAAESREGERTVYDVNPNYWDPSIQGVERIVLIEITDADARLNALITGQIHLAHILPGQKDRAERENLEVIGTPDRQWMIHIFDKAGGMVPELGDVRVRQAMNFAIDRQGIVDAVFFGVAQPGTQMFPPGSIAHNPDAETFYNFDPDRARALLAEAGVANGFSFKVPILPVYQAWAEAWKAMLADVGIDAQLNVVAPGTLATENRSGAWPVGTQGVGAIHPHGDALAWLLPGAPLNPLGYVDERVVQLVEAAANPNISEEERSRKYQELSLYLTEQGWVVGTHYNDVLTAFRGDEVSGVKYTLRESLPSFFGVTVSS